MSSLVEILTNDNKKAVVVNDCLALLDQEVADKRGLSGIAIKAGYKTVKGFKPGFLRNVVTDLLPEFGAAIEPIYQEAKDKSEPVAAYLERSSGRVADALLAITDGKAEHSKHGLIKGTYKKLRPTARRHVEQAIPRLGRLVEKHAG